MDTIDVHDLPEEEAKLIEELVERLREKVKMRKLPQPIQEEEEEEVKFGSWPLGVKGKVTREEIYDYL